MNPRNVLLSHFWLPFQGGMLNWKDLGCADYWKDLNPLVDTNSDHGWKYNRNPTMPTTLIKQMEVAQCDTGKDPLQVYLQCGLVRISSNGITPRVWQM